MFGTLQNLLTFGTHQQPKKDLSIRIHKVMCMFLYIKGGTNSQLFPYPNEMLLKKRHNVISKHIFNFNMQIWRTLQGPNHSHTQYL